MQVRVVLHGDVAQHQAGEVADHELAGARGGHDHGVAALGHHLGGHALDGRHVLRYLGAEVGAVDHAPVAVGVGAVDGVAVEGEGRAGLHGALEHQADDVLDRDRALGYARVVNAVEVAPLPLLAVVVLQGVALDREYLVRAHEVPGAVQVLFGQAPEQVGVADGREDVVRLHAVVAVIGAQLQKLRQVLVPGVEVHRRRALAHTELVDGHGRVVDELYPAYDAARRAVKAADGAAGGAHLAEVETHAAAELADLGEVVYAAVDALQAVGHGVYEAAGELVIGLARVGERRRGHRDLLPAEHVVEPAHPAEAVRLLLHRQVQRDAEVHLLRRLERHAPVGLYHVASQHQVEAGVGEQLVALRPDEGRRLLQLGAGVVLEYVPAVEPLVGQIAQLFIEAVYAPALQLRGQLQLEAEVQKPRRDELPLRRLLGGQLHRGLHQRGERLAAGHAALEEAGELAAERGQRVLVLREVALYAEQAALQARDSRRLGQRPARRAQLRALLPVEYVALGGVVEAVRHQRALHLVLYGLHRARPRAHRALHLCEHGRELLLIAVLVHALEGLAHRAGYLVRVVALHFPAAFYDVHVSFSLSEITRRTLYAICGVYAIVKSLNVVPASQAAGAVGELHLTYASMTFSPAARRFLSALR